MAGKHTHVLPHCQRNSRDMGWRGYWANPGDWQTHHSHHPGHQRNSLSVSTPVHSSAAGKYGLLPRHNEHRIRSRCSRCLTFCLVFTPAALCWWAKNNDNKTWHSMTVTFIVVQHRFLAITDKNEYLVEKIADTSTNHEINFGCSHIVSKLPSYRYSQIVTHG